MSHHKSSPYEPDFNDGKERKSRADDENPETAGKRKVKKKASKKKKKKTSS